MSAESEVRLGEPLTNPKINGNAAFHAEVASFVGILNRLQADSPRQGVLRLNNGFTFDLELANLAELAAGEEGQVHVTLKSPVTGTNRNKAAMTIGEADEKTGKDGTEVLEFVALKALSGSSRPINTRPRQQQPPRQREYSLWAGLYL